MQNAVYELIPRWLKQRQSLLIALYDLCHHRPFFLRLNCQELQGALQEFSGQILDYLSLGHFKIYESILDYVGQPLSNVVTQLNGSTHQILNLNDKYRFKLNVKQLDKDLGALTEILAKRFELEDKLISSTLGSTHSRKRGLSWLN